VAAGRLGETAARDDLRDVVTSGREPAELQVQAALALGNLGDASAAPALTRALDRDRCGSVELCRQVIRALGKLGDRRATTALVAHLPEVQNRREMVEALGAIADPAAVPALADRLAHDEYVPVRVAAASALARIGGEPARQALARAAADETEVTVLAATKAALRGIAAAKPASNP
jgi:HEAT repeat protein